MLPILTQPVLSALAAQPEQLSHQLGICPRLAGCAIGLKRRTTIDAVHQHMLVAIRIQPFLLQQAHYEFNSTHLRQQAGIKRYFIDALHDFTGAVGQVIRHLGIDLHQQNVAALGVVHQRVQGRVA